MVMEVLLKLISRRLKLIAIPYGYEGNIMEANALVISRILDSIAIYQGYKGNTKAHQ